jgi:hypothetical protein
MQLNTSRVTINIVIVLYLMSLSAIAVIFLFTLTPFAQIAKVDGTLANSSTDYFAPLTTQYVTPITGDTIAVTSSRNTTLLINPSGTLATLTVNLPLTPIDGDIVTMSSSQVITALTIGSGTIVGTLSTLSIAGFARFQYNAVANKWFRVG